MFNVLALLLTLALAHAGEERGHVRARLGALYDSNILIAPDSMFDQGEPSRYRDFRLLTAGDLSYAIVAGSRHRWAPAANVELINTAQARHAAGDPYRFALSGPYTFDTTAYRLIIRPTAQSLMMDPTLTTSKSVVQQSQIVAFENLWRSAPAWSTAVDVEYRRDVSGLRSSVGVDDGDADKVSAFVGETWSPGGSPARAFAFRAGYIANQARGVNRRYRRTQASFGYEGPLGRGASVWTDVSVYRLEFPRAAIRRRDTNLGAALGFRIPLRQGLELDLGATYARNQDPVRLFKYDRVATFTTLTYTGGF